MSNKKIVIISTTQPATNPRLVKEADFFSKSGCHVTVLYCFVADWAQQMDRAILSTVKWRHQQVGGDSYTATEYRLSRIRFAIFRLLNRASGNIFFKKRALARCYSELLKAAKRSKADLFIGHNPGALAIVAEAAKALNVKAGFDFEDYHRGEYIFSNQHEVRTLTALENRYLPTLNYVSASSPLITKKIEEDHPSLRANVVTLLNCFPVLQQYKLQANDRKDIRLFWFSQNIGENRGLEVAIDAIRIMNNPDLSLTLVGNYTEAERQKLLHRAGDSSRAIYFAGVISPELIPAFAADFDIGLALELNLPTNRDLCLTNKIFTYVLAGNAIIFSNTKAQLLFNKQYDAGEVFKLGDVQTFINCVEKYYDKTFLSKQRHSNYILGRDILNWENEAKKLIQLVD